MADDITITSGANSTPPANTVIGTDDVSGVHYQKIKIALGADGAIDNLVDSGQQLSAASLPVVLSSDHSDIKVTLDSEAVTISGTVEVQSNSANLATETTAAAIQVAVELLDNAISGSEMQTDIVTMAAGASPDIGATTDAEATGNGSIIAILKRLRTLLGGTLTVSGTVTADAGTGPWPVTDNGGSITTDNDDTVSANNSTTSTLGIAGVYTGTGDDVLGYTAITIQIDASHDSAASGMTFQFSIDNTNWDDVYLHTYTAANDARRFQFHVQARYFRIVYTNGGTGQTHFRVQTILHRQNVITSIHRLADNVDPDRSAQLMKSILIAQANGSGEFIPVDSTAGGNLKVAVQEFDASASLPAGTNNIGDVDIATVPAPLSTTGGGTEATALRVTIASDSTGQVTIDGTVTIQDGGGAITIDHAALDNAHSEDYDTDAGTDTTTAFGIALPSISGAVAGGTATNPVRTDPTGTTTQPVSDGGGTLSVDDGAGSLTVDSADLATIAGAVSGSEMQADIVAPLPAGTNNIGDVDIASVPAPLSTTGGGTEATAQRVTIASDSSGVLSIDDNGGTLTVDGSVTADLGANNDVTIDGSSVVRAEDAVHNSGDTGIMALGVRNDTLAALVDTDGDYAPLQVDADGALYATTRNDNVISTNNSTTSTLGISGVFTGTGEDCLGFSSVTIQIDASHDSATDGMTFQFSIDNTNWDDIYTFSYTAADGARRFQYPVTGRYFRIVYTNGGTGQTHFRVQTGLHRQSILTSIHRVADSINPDRSAQLMKSVLIAQAAGSGDFVPVDATAAGNLKVAIEEFDASLPAGTNNIGDVDIASVPAPLSTTGGGTEATAQRVTIASDSSGVLSVDDNGSTLSVDDGGGALTVDGTITASNAAGDIAHDAADSGNPIKIGGRAVETDGTDPGEVAEDDRTDIRTDMNGRMLVNTNHPNNWYATGNWATAQTDVEVKAAPGAGLHLYITDIILSTDTAMNIRLEHGTTDVIPPMYLAATGGLAMPINTPIRLPAATSLTLTSSAAGNHSVFVSGYTAP